MRISSAKIGTVVGCFMVAASPGFAQDALLDPLAEEGRVLYEEAAGGIGCAYCHGDDATGDIGPDILGQDPVAILEALRIVPDMGFIELSESEADAVAAYLRHLHDLAAH